MTEPHILAIRARYELAKAIAVARSPEQAKADMRASIADIPALLDAVATLTAERDEARFARDQESHGRKVNELALLADLEEARRDLVGAVNMHNALAERLTDVEADRDAIVDALATALGFEDGADHWSVMTNTVAAIRQSEAEAADEIDRLRADRDEARRVIRNAHEAIRTSTTAAAVALAMFAKADEAGPSLVDELGIARAERDEALAKLKPPEGADELIDIVARALAPHMQHQHGEDEECYNFTDLGTADLADVAIGALLLAGRLPGVVDEHVAGEYRLARDQVARFAERTLAAEADLSRAMRVVEAAQAWRKAYAPLNRHVSWIDALIAAVDSYRSSTEQPGEVQGDGE